MILFRVDNRLIHGQIIEAWLPHINARHVIVAHDGLVQDLLRQQIMRLAVPQRVQIHFMALTEVPQALQNCAAEMVLVLFESISDLHAATVLYSAQQMLHPMPKIELNIGNTHYSAGKKELCSHIFVTEEEKQILMALDEKFFLDLRSIPSEKARSLHELF